MNLTPLKYMLGASLAGLEERQLRQAEQAVRDAVQAARERRNDVTNLVFSGYPPEMAERIVVTHLFDANTFLRVVGPYREPDTCGLTFHYDAKRGVYAI